MKPPVMKFFPMFAVAGPLVLAALPPPANASRQSTPKSPFHPAATQEVATLKVNENTYASPGGKKTWTISKTRPITGEATTIPVLQTKQQGTATWLDVRLPGRAKPNQHPPATGW